MINPFIDLTQRIASLFAALPQTEAIALGGSLAANTSDAASDIDLYVYTCGEISLSERKILVEHAGGAVRADLGMNFWGPGDEWYDAATGIEVDIVYFDTSWMVDQIHRVMVQHQPSLGYTTCFVHTIANSQILYDLHGRFAALKALCTQPYPPELQQNILAYNNPVLRSVIPSYYHQIEKALQRGDLISINHRLANLLASYFDMLFALNRVMHPGEKRLLASALARCQHLPSHMAEDLRSILAAGGSGDTSLLDHLTRLLDRLDELLAASLNN